MKKSRSGSGYEDDVAGEVCAAYFAMREDEMPKSVHELERWCVSAAARCRTMLLRSVRREVSVDETAYRIDRYRVGEMASYLLEQAAAERPDLARTNKPHQLLRCEVMDALKMIDALPADQRSFVMRVVTSETIEGYSKDHDVSLFQAMKDLKSARALMIRLAEDAADERKEIAYANESSRQRESGAPPELGTAAPVCSRIAYRRR